ncbi:MAG: hypothetical protein QOK02_5464 [Mycobacterium sp.]|nr:hypothetical protein [Mycobacterium sp.]
MLKLALREALAHKCTLGIITEHVTAERLRKSIVAALDEAA